MSVRFMPDGRLKTEDGRMLDAGPPMTREDSLAASGAASRVLLHSYPDTHDITGETGRVTSLLQAVELSPELEGHSARIYRNGSERILVIEHRH